MKKWLKVLLIVSLFLFCAGSILFGFGMISVKGDVSKFSHLKVVNASYAEQAENPVSSIRITHSAPADVKIIFSDAATAVTMEYGRVYTKKGAAASYFSLTDENGELRMDVRSKPSKSWIVGYQKDPKITLTLPSAREYGIFVKTSTGDIKLTGEGKISTLTLTTNTGDISTEKATLTANEMRFEVDTGDVKIGRFTANTLNAEADTGDITLFGGEAAAKIQVDTDTGDVRIKGALTASEIRVNTDTGDCKMKEGVLNANVISLETDTGDISVTLFGKKADYSIYVNTDTGDSNVTSEAGGEKTLKIDTDTGDVNVYFQE